VNSAQLSLKFVIKIEKAGHLFCFFQPSLKVRFSVFAGRPPFAHRPSQFIKPFKKTYKKLLYTKRLRILPPVSVASSSCHLFVFSNFVLVFLEKNTTKQ